MSKRREGRETAVQLLFSRDFVPSTGLHDIDAFFELHSAKPDIRRHAEEVYQGVVSHLEVIDRRLVAALENFSLERLAGVDRNILRVAIYEMFHCPAVPPIVAINEAIEISKRFGTPDSSRFVNGVLDRLKGDLTRPLREAGS
ncbi:MAG: nusB [Verrucomicrobiales bacterium]|nr:nusB [Verrucomicrobiales bacterium]